MSKRTLRYFVDASNKTKEKYIEPKNNYNNSPFTDEKSFHNSHSKKINECGKKYSRGENVTEHINIKSKYQRIKELQREKRLYFAAKTAAKTEILLTEEYGYIIPENEEESYELTQKDILENVDISTANKSFILNLEQFGPYTMDYSRNGRDLLLGGTKGHLSGFEWHTKKLKFEVNVGEAINCVRWLHTENMLAVGQKRWAHIYDNTGTELHCLKKLYDVLQMEFLPYHFLLAAANSKGFLSWLDISLGKIVSHLYTGLGRLNVVCQNPQNAIICVGSSNGCVSMWSPNCASSNSETCAKPLAKILCHRCPIKSVAIDSKGMYMATCDIDKNLHLWDLRNYKILDAFRLTGCANRLAFSQNQHLALSIGSRIEIYKDSCSRIQEEGTSPYMLYDVNSRSTITDLQFCPFEDVLGIGHSTGFTSIIVPGSGEANFDSFEANPYQTKSQRKEAEVKALLGKIQPELISLDAGNINKVNVITLQEKLEQRNKILSLKPRKIDIRIKKRKFKKATSARKVAARKQEILSEKTKDFYDDLSLLDMIGGDTIVADRRSKIYTNTIQKFNALDCFKPKKAKKLG